MNAMIKTASTSVAVLTTIALGYGFTHSSGQSGTPRVRTDAANAPVRSDAASTAASTPPSPPATAPSAIRDATCELEAVPTLPSNADSRLRKALDATPFAQALDPSEALDRDAAIRQADQASSEPSKVNRSAAARVPYNQALEIFGGGPSPLIATTRCVWVVSVDGPFAGLSVRPGAKVAPAKGYTIAIDAASGEVLDGRAGVGSPSLITGANLPTKQ
ncbi:hypothetical protein [Nocardioides marmorisolisilvae]|uniref:hypothetical protein n=1 Tax=Nocardioides marmorisolisilvae TaxID=1542737 RepID=UPI0011CE0E30|nr:hypothetical protein [Nocardioides marmorisolisilvae]